MAWATLQMRRPSGYSSYPMRGMEGIARRQILLVRYTLYEILMLEQLPPWSEMRCGSTALYGAGERLRIWSK